MYPPKQLRAIVFGSHTNTQTPLEWAAGGIRAGTPMVIRSMFAPSLSHRLFPSHYAFSFAKLNTCKHRHTHKERTNSLAIVFASTTAIPDPPNERSILPGTIAVRSQRSPRCAFARRCGQTRWQKKRGRHNPLSIELDALAHCTQTNARASWILTRSVVVGWMGTTLYIVYTTTYVRMCVHVSCTALCLRFELYDICDCPTVVDRRSSTYWSIGGVVLCSRRGVEYR